MTTGADDLDRTAHAGIAQGLSTARIVSLLSAKGISKAAARKVLARALASIGAEKERAVAMALADRNASLAGKLDARSAGAARKAADAYRRALDDLPMFAAGGDPLDEL